MGVLRFERRTSVLSGQRSNHLSYTPKRGFILTQAGQKERRTWGKADKSALAWVKQKETEKWSLGIFVIIPKTAKKVSN